jgi:subtilisin family serine protease
MAKKRSKKAGADAPRLSGNGSGGANGATPMSGLAGQPTGRYLVTIKEGAEKAGLQAVQSTLGVRSVAMTSDYKEGLALDEMSRADAAVLSEVGVLIVSGAAAADLEAMAALEGTNAIEAVEPEFYVEAIQLEHETPPEEYVRGFRDSAAALYRGLFEKGEAEVGAEALAVFNDTAAFTWGLQATGVTRTRFTGRGIRVAVLDTGLDLNHPDFRGRSITPQSFVPGVVSVQDGHSHGTHCIGTALGPTNPPRPPGARRYGCAPGADIFVGKVLNDGGGGMAGWALAGIDWAIRNRCEVVSMSLGWIIPPSHPDSVAFETAASRGLARGTLVIAAAGNEGPSGGLRSPANVPSVLAVGAVGNNLSTASFSSRGDVNIAGPGVDTFSTVPLPARYGVKSGTSMATPHVAGIAALWAESDRRFRGRALASILMARTRPLPLPANQVGKGLVQAP